MKKALALVFALLFIAPYAAADGMIFIEDADMWYLQPETNQVAAIHYENGMENMLISVSPGSELRGDRAVWIFPVPAAPESVHTDIIRGFPRYTGSDYETKYRDAVIQATAIAAAWATFPLCVFGGGVFLGSMFMFGMAGSLSKSSDIQVYERVEKMGVVTEVVAAKDADAFSNFLVLRGMAPTSEGKELLQSYIGQDYTFVVTSIPDVEGYRNALNNERAVFDDYGMSQPNMIGVFVRFPTDRIYFPLKPTSVYGNREVPVLMYTTGFVTPELYDGIRDGTRATYFSQEWYRPPAELQPFFNGKTEFGQLDYTKIKITVPADHFTEDLWIDPHPPASLGFQEAYMKYILPVTALVFAIFSAVASLLAGLLVFKKKQPKKLDLLLHGLWNCATFIGFAVMTRRKFPQEEYGKRGRFVLAFYVIFGLLLSAYTVALAPDSMGLILFGWIMILLSPLFSLILLAFVPVMFLGIFSGGPGEILFAILAGIVLLILAICPLPVLVWLIRWMDPEMPPPPAALEE